MEIKLEQPLTFDGAPYLQHLPTLRSIQLTTPFLDSSVSLLDQLTAVIFSPAATHLPDSFSVACANLAVLQDLAGLRRLELNSTYIHDISQLAALTQLHHLKLRRCKASSCDASSSGTQTTSALDTLHVIFGSESLADVRRVQDEQLPPLRESLLAKGLIPSLLHQVRSWLSITKLPAVIFDTLLNC